MIEREDWTAERFTALHSLKDWTLVVLSVLAKHLADA
jgi:hypothetical protein